MKKNLMSLLASSLLLTSAHSADTHTIPGKEHAESVLEYLIAHGSYVPSQEETTDFGLRKTTPYKELSFADVEFTYVARLAMHYADPRANNNTLVVEVHKTADYEKSDAKPKPLAWISDSLPAGFEYKLGLCLTDESGLYSWNGLLDAFDTDKRKLNLPNTYFAQQPPKYTKLGEFETAEQKNIRRHAEQVYEHTLTKIIELMQKDRLANSE
jgi:hypothetical protein